MSFMAVNAAVSITKSISVYPKVLVDPPKVLPLSNLDRQCPNLMYMVFFYKSSHQDLCLDSVFSRLKAGLEATLSNWYPAAGRLNPDHDGKLNIWCNSAGAILVQAVTQVKISELGDLSVYNDFFENLVFKPLITDGNITEMPLVVAQVTRFDCGGYSIGIGSSHSLFDGRSAFDFLNAWASQTQGLSQSQLHRPVHERGTLLMDQDSTSSNYSSNPTAIDHLYQLIRQANPDDQNQETSLTFETFRLSTSMIERLKKKVFGEKRDKLSCSTFQLLAAHLWKVKTKALRLERERKVCLQFAVDVRNKIVPPIPKGFSGNGYVLASVVSTAGELEEQSHEYIIKRINETKNDINDEYVKAYIKGLEGPEATLPPLSELTVVSDWTRIPFHRVDFLGEEAAYASPLPPPIPQVAYFMQNPDDCRAMDVRIGLLPRIQPAFSQNFINII